MGLTIEMVNPQEQLLEEIIWPGMTQESIGITYAFIVAQEPDADWAKINQAIRERWKGRTALERIKKMAWKHLEHWHEKGKREAL